MKEVEAMEYSTEKEARCAERWQNMTPSKRKLLAEALALLEASSEEIIYQTVKFLKLIQ